MAGDGRKSKVIFVGVNGVGKTSLFLRIRDDKFYGDESRKMTCDYFEKEVTVETGEKVVIQLWDTAGMDRYKSLTHSYYLGSQVILYTYNADDIDSVDKLTSYLNEAGRHAPGAKKVLIRNKSDLSEQSVRKDEVEPKLEKNGHIFQPGFLIDTSALTGKGVDTLLQRVGTYLLDHAKPIEKKDNFGQYGKQPVPQDKPNNSGGPCCS